LGKAFPPYGDYRLQTIISNTFPGATIVDLRLRHQLQGNTCGNWVLWLATKWDAYHKKIAGEEADASAALLDRFLTFVHMQREVTHIPFDPGSATDKRDPTHRNSAGRNSRHILKFFKTLNPGMTSSDPRYKRSITRMQNRVTRLMSTARFTQSKIFRSRTGKENPLIASALEIEALAHTDLNLNLFTQ
jgi:hypothetical protein